MDDLIHFFLSYWSLDELRINCIIVLHLLGAIFLGAVVGLERSRHGGATGIRTYMLVSLASCALTILHGYPVYWYGGHSPNPNLIDAGRTIQGIMTGIGFLGAGVIMQSGLTVRGLTTAASIWTTAAIGIMVGVGFYAAAIAAAVLCVSITGSLRLVERIFPHQRQVALTLGYTRDKAPSEEEIVQQLKGHGFTIIDWAFAMVDDGKKFQYQLMLMDNGYASANKLAADFAKSTHVSEFKISRSHS
jgi:putative Mg2+ transporter-C (MgtC) family protein